MYDDNNDDDDDEEKKKNNNDDDDDIISNNKGKCSNDPLCPYSATLRSAFSYDQPSQTVAAALIKLLYFRMAAQALAFSSPCDFELRSMYIKLISNCNDLLMSFISQSLKEISR